MGEANSTHSFNPTLPSFIWKKEYLKGFVISLPNQWNSSFVCFLSSHSGPPSTKTQTFYTIYFLFPANNSSQTTKGLFLLFMRYILVRFYLWPWFQPDILKRKKKDEGIDCYMTPHLLRLASHLLHPGFIKPSVCKYLLSHFRSLMSLGKFFVSCGKFCEVSPYLYWWGLIHWGSSSS